MNFGNPKNYGDWTQYAGFDSSKPMMGIVPSFGQEMVKQPVAPTIAQIGQRVQDVGTQLGQGNFANAAKTFINGAAVPGVSVAPNVTSATPASKDVNGDGMISDWEE